MKIKLLIVFLIALLFVFGCNDQVIDTVEYSIEVDPNTTNGIVEVVSSAEYLDEVTFKVTPDAGYKVEAIYINGEKINQYYFQMPKEDVEIYVIFVEETTVDCIEQHDYQNGACINCKTSIDSIVLDVFGQDVEIYDMDDRNPYGINLSAYGSDVYAIIYEPQINLVEDMYNNVNKEAFYSDYQPAKTYEEAYYRSKHYLMSGDITPQDEKAEVGAKINGKYSKISTAFYILDSDGNYLGYLPNNANENDYIIYYGGAYTSLEDIAAYMQAFGNQPVNTDFSKNDKSSAVSLWGKYGRVNNGKFSANSSKYPYQPSLPSASYIESDFGHQGGFVINGKTQSIYNNGNSITRGTARFVYTKTSGIVSIDKRCVFYTYNHYNDFQEYLNYIDGWTNRFGNESAGNPYCSGSSDWNSSYNAPTQREEYIITRFNEYHKSI